jgi:co-chaperonin GroES (HSP10)
MQPLGHKVIIVKDEDKEREIGGLIVIRKDTHGEMNQATVKAVGKDVTDVRPGDRVLVLNGMGIDFIEGSEKFVVLFDHEIEAVLES